MIFKQQPPVQSSEVCVNLVTSRKGILVNFQVKYCKIYKGTIRFLILNFCSQSDLSSDKKKIQYQKEYQGQNIQFTDKLFNDDSLQFQILFMTTLNLEFGFNVPRQLIYQALTDQNKIMQYTRSRAIVDAKEGGQFSMLDGRIVGKFLSLRPGEYIKMEWKFNDWKESSIVQIVLQDPEEDQCDVYLTHSRIPANEKKEKIEFGWREYYFTAINKLLGYAIKE